MFVPGSHLWDDERRVRADEVCFAGKDFVPFFPTTSEIGQYRIRG
jgi:hypothetical protein